MTFLLSSSNYVLQRLCRSTTISIAARGVASVCSDNRIQPQYKQQQQQHQEQRRCMGHNVKIILKEDLPTGKSYKGEIITVKAGFARNYLIPQQYAVYATEENYRKLKIEHPDLVSIIEQQQKQLSADEDSGATSAAKSGNDDDLVKAAEVLKKYLRNKTLKIWRNIDLQTLEVFPGNVTSKHLRSKLSKQLKIDLESNEQIHIRSEPLVSDEDYTPELLQTMVESTDTSEPCQVQLRNLGTYVARITLEGGYAVPLRFVILKR